MFENKVSKYDRQCAFAIEMFNNFARKTGIRKALRMNNKRRACLSRILSMSVEDVHLFLSNLRKSTEFFKEHPELYYFEWFTTDTAITNIMEGKYTVSYKKNKVSIPNIKTQVEYIEKGW